MLEGSTSAQNDAVGAAGFFKNLNPLNRQRRWVVILRGAVPADSIFGVSTRSGVGLASIPVGMTRIAEFGAPANDYSTTSTYKLNSVWSALPDNFLRLAFKSLLNLQFTRERKKTQGSTHSKGRP